MAKKRTATQEAEEEAKRKRHGWNKKKKRKVLNKEELLKGKVKKFDPRGSGYDQKNAPPRKPANPSAGKEGIPHQDTRNPRTGQILKGQKHPTFRLGMEGEEEAGYTIHRDELTGRLFSRARRNPSAAGNMVSIKELLEENDRYRKTLERKTATQEAEEEAKRKRQKTDYNKKKKR